MGKGIEWLSALDRIIVIKVTRKNPKSTGLYSASYMARASGGGGELRRLAEGQGTKQKNAASAGFRIRLDGLIVNQKSEIAFS